ncbi:MAG: DNA polymerase III subunit beta [Pseudarcicella sp.]|nr:DNA polymerase III subunit beta [Pseudarcicella sp.]MBP6409469.1 DNA polymerase III subunit beta [Pseudarcicella sp.]
MKFVISSSVLLKQLSLINGVVASNTLLPILENFLFELEENILSVTASDQQTVMVATIDVDAQESGSIAIPAKLLLDTLRGLPEQPITIKVDSLTFGIEIISENGRYKLSGENPIDFPVIPPTTKTLSLKLNADVLSSAISNTLFATAVDDMRPAMAGVYLNMNPDYTTFVSTDGHRLIRYRRTDIKAVSETSMILPRKALNLLKSSLPSDSTEVSAEFNQSNAFFSFLNIKMICRLIDERFPDYENAIPLENPNLMTIGRSELLSSLKRISIYSNKTTHQVRMKLSNNDLVVSAEDINYANEANERLTCFYEGDDMEVGYSAKFLIEMLSNMASKTITLQMSTPNRAGLLVPEEQNENESILMLIMPVILTSPVN